MEVKVKFLDNLRLEACFDDYKILTDQPARYKGDGQAPSPFDYFLASSALCAAYFVKVYCKARNLPTEDISITQNNIVDPEDRYNQIFKITAKIPDSFSDKHKEGIMKAMDRCTVKKVIQAGPEFDIEALDTLVTDDSALVDLFTEKDANHTTMIKGKDASLEETIQKMTGILSKLGIKIEIASWRNIVENVWSVHIRDTASPLCFTNGKGATKESALCSALGEYIERISCNYFYNDHFLGPKVGQESFSHYPDEKWFKSLDGALPEGILDSYTKEIYSLNGELSEHHLYDTNTGLSEKGICAIPFVRQSDKKRVFFPVSLVGNLFVSNGMSAGNTKYEARVQCLSEIFERAVKKEIILNELALPDVPEQVLARFPKIYAGIKDLESKGFPLLFKDASLGGKYPVMCVALMNPKTGGVFCSFGAHPSFEVALERSLTELMQGRSFEGFNDVLKPTFNSLAIQEPNNFVEHFIDSNGVVSWKFFSNDSDYDFCDWDFSGTTEEENHYLMEILKKLEKEVYIADYTCFGAHACRILVPGYSEIYDVNDLIWENTNIAIKYREDILSLHRLNNSELELLLEKLEDDNLDHFMEVSTLIGIEFDDNSVWGKLNIGELKLLVHLALGDLESASERTREFLAFNDNTKSRQLFYQAVDAVLHIVQTPELNIENYQANLRRMFGDNIIDDATDLVLGRTKFHGLTETSINLEGLEKHNLLIESYLKLHSARKKKIISV